MKLLALALLFAGPVAHAKAKAAKPKPTAPAYHLSPEGVLMDKKNEIVYLDLMTAAESCPKDTHLATIHELATMMEAYGSRVMNEAADESSGEDYRRFHAGNHDGTEETFYYSNEHYRCPNMLLQTHIFWAASFAIEEYPGAGYALSGGVGSIIFMDKSAEYALFCLKNK